jgi:hypothetical protein
MKSDVYSWRIDPEKKADLEAELRRAGITLAKLLDDFTTAWLKTQRDGSSAENAAQALLRKRVMATVGTIRSEDPRLASKVNETVSRRVVHKLRQELNGRRSD